MQKTRKALEKQLDEAWSKAVKIKAGYSCEYCRNKQNLNSHHIYSRVKKTTRWDLDNGICLCVAHHIGAGFSAHKTPTSFTLWLIEKKGKQFVDLLTLKSNQIGKYSPFELEIKLKELKQFIKENENV